ncbi:MAG: hypothetical protein J5819_05425 [Eubacterium sp.]|nr:hypothetical protein [Eubacterium sp.]
MEIVDPHSSVGDVYDRVFSGQPIMLSLSGDKNIVMLSKTEFDELQRIKNNAAFIEKLDKSREEYKNGRVVIKTMDELEAMAAVSENMTMNGELS